METPDLDAGECMTNFDGPGGPSPKVVVLYAFDSALQPAYDVVQKVFWIIFEKIDLFASSGISYIKFSASDNTYRFAKWLVRAKVELIQREQSRPCTKNMACGLPEANRLISEYDDDNDRNGIIFFFSDGSMQKGDFFDGAEDFPSTWPVHTFTVGGDEFNKGLRAIAANSPGGTFYPLPVPHRPGRSAPFLQYVYDILGIIKDDEKPPTRDADAEGINARTGLVTMNKLTYSKNDVALTTADTLTVGVELNAAPSATAREGLDLVVLVNVFGRELDMVKKAMQYVIMKLTAMDRLSILYIERIRFANKKGIRRCPLRCMTPSGKAHLKAFINSLDDMGVDLMNGLMEALAVLHGRCHTEGRTANIFLLTSYLSRNYEDLLRSIDFGNVAIHTFGFVVYEHTDFEVMHDIFKGSPGGTYSFVPLDDYYSYLCAAFSQILAGLLTTVAQDVQLTLTSKGKDVDNMEVCPGLGYKHTTNINSRGEKEITISFGAIFSGESRKVSVNFSLNPSENSDGSLDAIIAEVQHSYNAQQGVERQPPRAIHIRRALKPTGVLSADAVQLHAEDIRCQHANTIRDAVARAQAGMRRISIDEAKKLPAEEFRHVKFCTGAAGHSYMTHPEHVVAKKLEEARSILEDGLDDVEDIMLDNGDKMLGVLRYELHRLIKYMASEELCVELGYGYALATMISHGLQRAVAKGNEDPAAGCLYLTPRMIANLKQAKQYVEDPMTPLPSADDDLKEEIAAAVAGPLAI